jgi:integrase
MGLRDYAMILLIATYGLRASEVVAVTLDDIRWRQGNLRIQQRKTSSPLELPLTNEVSAAIVKHLKRTPPPRPISTDLSQNARPDGFTKAFSDGGSLSVRGAEEWPEHFFSRRALPSPLASDPLGKDRNPAQDRWGYPRASYGAEHIGVPPSGHRRLARGVSRGSEYPGQGSAVMTAPPAFSSLLAPIFIRYVSLKRALGRRFATVTWNLQSLDRFLHNEAGKYPDLDVAAFHAWCRTHENVASGVRRDRMFDVYNFCLYRQRTEPNCFVPDPDTFPARHQTLTPYIFSEADVARLLTAAADLTRHSSSPLRPEVARLAIVLLFTIGIRRGELVKLTLDDYNRQESTLHIRETKFFKSRLLPVNGEIAKEIERYLRARIQRGLPASPNTPFIWNATRGGRSYTGAALQRCLQPLLKECRIFTPHGKLPRIHDFRHSFAVNALLRWYRMGADVGAKLPLLATYMGHGSAVSTHYYLQFIEPLRAAASQRFADHYSALVAPLPAPEGRNR